MLPNGVLSKHGYTVQWGFFQGICPGSGRLPFEQSTDAIADAIANVKRQIVCTKASIAQVEDLSNPINDGSNVWVRIYTDAYRWVKAKLHDFSVDSVTYSRPHAKCSFTTLESFYKRGYGRNANEQAPITEKVEAYDAAWEMPTLQHWARFLNRKMAAQWASEVKQREGWVSWQNERVKNWKPEALTPR